MSLPKFRLSLLSAFRLTGPDGPVHLASKKLAGLLAYLACTAPARQSREKLATLLWGSHLDTQAQQNLRQALFRLRRALGEGAIVGDGDEVWLAPGVIDCDVARLQALIREGSGTSLAAAIDLYKDGLLSDVSIPQDSWTDWVAGERQRLEDLALDALLRFAGIELAAGRADKALETAHRALAINRLREDAHRLILQALAAAGRKAEALKHYQDFVALLKRELNTQPDAATSSIVAALGSTEPPRSPPAVSEIAQLALQPDPPSIALHAADPAAREVSSIAVRQSSPEQRQLTIMACHLVGSMPLSAHFDPEDMHDLIAAFHKMAADEVARFNGFVARYLSDGVLVYFGYPAAHEHDAERAVRAGFAIRDAVGTLKTASDVTLQARAGIATGLVVVGEQPGTGVAREPIAIGETPTLAAQLQATAAPGEVVIAASTRRLVGRMFDCRALPAIEVKGQRQAVDGWQVRGEAAGVSRFDARRAGALSPFVGRQEEIDLLLRRWDHAGPGEGRVVLLAGEPGIGKSRIAESLLTRLEDEAPARLRYFCSPHHTHSPLYPFIAQLEQAAGFEPGSSAEAKLDRLEALLGPTSKEIRRDVALIAELLAVPAEGRYPVLAVSPQQKREMTLNALLDQLEGAAANSPVLIVFEDVHWIDPTSLNLLDRMVARAENLPLLLVMTFRPEFQPTWVGQAHVTMLSLNRLGRRDSAALIRGITRSKALPDAVLEQVLARTDGVPLLIEELTSTLLESGLLRETNDSYVLDGPLPLLAVPMTLQASLVARLDRLGPVKEVALIGAAIGREFSHELVAAVSALSPIDLDASLERLTASGLVFRHGTPPDAIYSFRHALVQDAAYLTMLKSRRRQLHARIAKVLVERFAAMVERLPEVAARHFTEGGLASEAISYWRRAGQLASARSAGREAVKFFEQALHLLETQPETRERLEQAIDLRFDLRTALVQLGELERIFSYLHEAEGLARTLRDQRRLGEVSAHMCHNLWMTGRHREALMFGQSAGALGESLGNVSLQVTGNLHLGAACLGTGDYRQAEESLSKVVQLVQGEPSPERFGLPGFPTVMARSYLTWVFGDRGKFVEGIASGREGIRIAETLDHPYSLTLVLWYLAHLQIIRGELGEAAGLIERGLTVARESNLTPFSIGNTGSLGYVYALLGRTAEGIPLMEHTVSALDATGHQLARSFYLVPLGEAYVLAGRLDGAAEFAGRALTLAREGGRRPYEARALRLLGDVTARLDSPQRADGHYRDALALAAGLGMRPLVAHCHLGLGKLYRRIGTLEQARQHLTAAAAMYREMEMTFWLEQIEAEAQTR